MSSTQSNIATGISIKSAFGEDLRKFQLNEFTLKKLRETLGSLYQLHPFSFQVKYIDEEGDLITLSNDNEFQSIANTTSGILKLTVVPKPLLADKQAMKRELRLEKLKEKLAKKQEKVAEKNAQRDGKSDESEVNNTNEEKKIDKWAQKEEKKAEKEAHKQEKKAEKEAKKEEKREKKVIKCARMASLTIVPKHPLAVGRGDGNTVIPQGPMEFVFKKKDLSKPQGRFVRDVTFPDGSYVAPGATFIKTWRFRNEGTTAWPQGSSLLFLSKQGDNLSSPESVPVTETVEPGKEVDISVTLKAPEQSGRYVSYYRLCAPDKKKFGQRVRLLVQVGGDSSSSSSEKDEPVTASDETAFADKLALLAQMGFTNNKKNIRLIKKFNGDLNRVVTKLVQHQTKVSKISHDI